MTDIRTDVSFVGVGDGSELARLKKRIQNEKIYNVLLLGKRNDIEDLISIADIGLLFTHAEGISNSIIEYMALGKPVITTDTLGGSNEIIEEGKSGYIMQSNAFAIANKINELLNNPILSKKLGEKGNKSLNVNSPSKRMGKKYIELYNKNLNFSNDTYYS